MKPAGKEKSDNLTKLRMEKYKLKTFCTYQEKLIALKIEYFRENYPKVLGESLLPYEKSVNTKVRSILDAVNDLIAKLLPEMFEGKQWSGMLLKLLQIIMIRLFNRK